MNRFVRSLLLIIAIPVFVQLTGCAAAIVGAGVTAGAAANDRRSTGAFIDDELIEPTARIVPHLLEHLVWRPRLVLIAPHRRSRVESVRDRDDA